MRVVMYSNDDFFRVIGHISVFFATLDLFTSEVIVRLMPGDPTTTPPFPENSTLGQKLALLEKLKSTEVTNSDVLLDLQEGLPRAQAAAKERNRYMHDQWVFDSGLIAQGRIRRVRLVFGSPLKANIQELTIQDLQAFLSEVGELQKVFAQALKILNPSGVALQGA